MKAYEILLSLDREHLNVCKISDDEIAVQYQDADVKEGYFLISQFGCGGDFESACEDYLSKIRGKTLVFGACTKARHEIKVLG